MSAARCAERVYPPGWHHAGTCSRKPGHGPDGAYCKQHALRYAEATMPLWHVQSWRPYRIEEVAAVSSDERWVVLEGGQRKDAGRYYATRQEAEAARLARMRGDVWSAYAQIERAHELAAEAEAALAEAER